MEKTAIPKLPWNIYWINLDRRPDRKIHMEEILINNKENSFRIQAVDYKNNFSPYTVIQHAKLNGGEHGCTCSHIKALHYFLTTSTDEYCFVAEDDLSNEYSQYWQDEHYELLKNGNYEMIQLQTTTDLYENVENKMIPNMKFGSGTTIYKIKRSIAETIVKNHFDEKTQTINLSNNENPLTDVFVYNYAKTYLLPMFSYLDVTDSDTNKDANKIDQYWQDYFQNAKIKYLNMWYNINESNNLIYSSQEYLQLFDNCYYIGSCRYVRLFKNYFPPRLHTTREILFFLKNYNNNNIFNNDLIDCIFGASSSIHIKNKVDHFIKYSQKYKSFFVSPFTDKKQDINTFCMEICSRKVFYTTDNIPLSHTYVTMNNLPQEKLKLIYLTNHDIHKDLIEIKKILLDVYNISNIIILSHFNLPNVNNDLYNKRQSLINDLKDISIKEKIHFIEISSLLHNYEINTNFNLFFKNKHLDTDLVNRFIEIIKNKMYKMDYFMPDNSHYNLFNHFFINLLVYNKLKLLNNI